MALTQTPVETPALDDVQSVAQLCKCSKRHILRLADAGKMPAPVKLGRLLRWRRADIETWISAGCPNVRKSGGAR